MICFFHHQVRYLISLIIIYLINRIYQFMAKSLQSLSPAIQTVIKQMAHERSRKTYEAERDRLALVARQALARGDDPVRAVSTPLKTLE
jgi:hypothetical protein